MTISEMSAYLDQIKSEYGDLEVMVYLPDYGFYTPVPKLLELWKEIETVRGDRRDDIQTLLDQGHVVIVSV